MNRFQMISRANEQVRRNAFLVNPTARRERHFGPVAKPARLENAKLTQIIV